MRPILCISAFFAAALLVFSCNKNSTQLAPITSTPKVLIVNGYLNGHAKIDVGLQQWHSTAHDSVSVSINNISGTALTNLRVIVEFCKAVPQNYDNCNLQFDTTIAALSSGVATKSKSIFIDKNVTLSENNVNVYIVSCDQAATMNPLMGAYVDSIVTLKNGAAITSYAFCNAYIQPDGIATIRFKVSDSIHYDITKGWFSDTSAFSGKLISAGQINALLTLGGITTNTANNKIFSLSLSKDLADSTDKISLNLKRN